MGKTRKASKSKQTQTPLTAQERKVLQLLKDYRAWHTAYGGAMAAEDSYIRSASYGAAAYIEQGQYWPKEVREAAADTYRLFQHALRMLQADGTLGMACYLTLLAPYLGDPADPSIVTQWRKTKPNLAEYHDLAVQKLARYLVGQDLFVVFPARMTSGEAKEIERRNDEAHRIYRELRADGTRKTDAVKTTALLCGYSVSRIWEIVKARASEVSEAS